MFSDDSYSEKKEDMRDRLVRERRFGRFAFLERLHARMRPGERLVLYSLFTVLCVSSLALLYFVNASVSVVVPAHGGKLTEGVVGSARFVNPLLALSAPDRDLSMLVYSGLMRSMPDGTLVPDLAASYEISEDGTIYTFKLKKGLTFHDGKPLTSADVAFTVQRAQSPEVKSSRRADWEGVQVGTPDASTVIFTLPHAYGPFLENTSLGILPRSLWESVPVEEFPFTPLNTHPVGSGPYKVLNFETNSTGAATRYDLVAFKQFALGEPYVSAISFSFYPNEDALIAAYNAGRVESVAGLSPSALEKLTRNDAYIVERALPRTFGVFFNQNKNAVLADSAVRDALAIAVDKEALLTKVLRGYGTALEGPIPPGVLGENTPSTPHPLSRSATSTQSDAARIEQGRSILTRGGWSFDEATGVWKKKNATLQFTLSTADEPELAATASILADTWHALGAKVDVHVYSLSELNTLVLRPRNYDAVLFGEIVGRTLDLFAFWHSSQRNDPGLNLALYTNAQVDALLSQARTKTDKREREKLYEQFDALVKKDEPAVFLFAPEFLYLVPKKLEGVFLGTLTNAAERFLNVHEWYVDTERVWDIFTTKTASL